MLDLAAVNEAAHDIQEDPLNCQKSILLRVIVLSFIFALSGATISYAEDDKPLDRAKTQALMQEAEASGDLDTMAELAEEVAFAELTDYLDASYELLRIHCQRGDETQAFQTIEIMLNAGFWDYRRLMSDEDLVLINSGEKLRTLVRAAWAKGYISMLERKNRDIMQHPAQIMEKLALKQGDVVADIGAGAGYFTIPMASAVGARGTVIATDIRQEMLDHIAAKLHDGGIKNVDLVKVEPGEPGLPAKAINTILMVDVMHYVKERTQYAQKLKEALVPGGRVVIIDFRYDPEAEREFAPPPEQQIPRETLDQEMFEAGFELDESFDFLPEQYFVIYRVIG